MHIPRVMCSLHRREMTICQTGKLIECVLTDGMPYYKIYADIFGCPGEECVVILPADRALIQHWQDGYGIPPAVYQVTLT